MSRLLVKGTQITVPNSVGAATSFSNATCVRLVNNSSSTGRVVTVAEDNSGSTTAPVSLFDNSTADVFGTYMIKV